jgi:penicillin G amidase
MKIVKFLLSLVFTLGLIFLLDRPQKVQGNDVPPLGHFFSPFSGFWQNAESPEHFVSRHLEMPGRKGKVSIRFDERLVPHIFAENLEDAVFAQGYITAMFRLWQMDMVSRLSGGRLAEVLGGRLLDNDKRQRRRGMVHGAMNAVKGWQESPEDFALIQAYAEGVNTYVWDMGPADFPLEFKLLNYQPEHWSVLKSALVKKYMDQTLCSGEDDLESTNALMVFGQDMFDKLYPEYNPKQTPVIPAGTKWDFPPMPPQAPAPIQEGVGLIEQKLPPKEREHVGSNNWAVTGSKTKSGKPILCNDPHLRLTLPSIWFEIQIHTPEFNAYGVSIPGIPGILIGFNEHTAWGETNVGQDVSDWYKINWTDAAHSSYEWDGGVIKAAVVVDTFRVKGQPQPVLDTVKWTAWGPVVYDDAKNPMAGLALRWIAHDVPNAKDVATFLGLDRGRNYDDYRKTLSYFDFPAQNFVFASNNGDIAITANGKFPLKKKEQGRFVQDGSYSANAWKGFIPREQVPATKNPERGFVASTNQHSTDPTYPYYYNAMAFDDFRGRYLVGELSRMENITPDDMKHLQNSTYSIQAAEGLPAMISLTDTTALGDRELAILKKMKSWNFRFEAEKTEPVIFLEWWDRVYRGTFDEVYAWQDSIPILMPEAWRLIDFLSTAPGDEIFDDKNTPDVETAREIVTAAFSATAEELADDLVNPGFNWAQQKKTSIMHLARIPALSATNLEVGGYKQALNAISESHGPSWRMVVELGDEMKGWGVFPGGQSGNPGSPYYKTGLEKWMNGDYYDLFFMKNKDDARHPVRFSIDFN